MVIAHEADPAKVDRIQDRILKGLEQATREGRPDVTFHVKQVKGDVADLCELAKVKDDGEENGSFDLEMNQKEMDGIAAVQVGATWKRPDFARLQISSALKRQAWSVTARIKYMRADAPAVRPPVKPTPMERHGCVLTNWLQDYPSVPDLDRSEFLTTFGMTCRVIDDVLGMKANDSGLILVSGQTGSGKSEILRGVMHRYLDRLVQAQRGKPERNERRNPHVLTFEDPIEAMLLQTKELPDCFSDLEIDYTPRVKGVDAKNLDEVINNALRQKPALLFVGEIRDSKDIKRCLEFAGTGHLVFATTHASSLLEGVQRALQACDANEPGTRAIWVPKIRAVVHLRNFPFGWGHGREKKALLPAMYVNSALAQHALVSDGLAALLPFVQPDTTDVKGALGRRYFVRRIHDEMSTLLKDAPGRIAALQVQEREAPADSDAMAALARKRAEWQEFLRGRETLEAQWRLNFSASLRANEANLEATAISADLNGE